MKRVIKSNTIEAKSSSIQQLSNRIDGWFNKGSKLFRTIADWGDELTSQDFVVEILDGDGNKLRMLCKTLASGKDGFTAKFILQPKDEGNGSSVESDKIRIHHQQDDESDEEYGERIEDTVWKQADKLLRKLPNYDYHSINNIRIVKSE